MKDLRDAFDELHEESVEEFLKHDAQREGLAWHVYCYKYGITGRAQVRRARRHEVHVDTDKIAEESEDDE